MHGKSLELSLLHCSPDIQVHPQDEYDRRSRVGTAVEEQDKDDVQRWTTKRKAALVLSIVRGETSIQEAARQHGLTVAEIEDWKERFFLGAENALRAKPKDDEALREEQIKKLKQKIGDLVMDIDILREAAKRHPPTPGTSEQ
jgi:transposase-like protein